MTKKKNETKEKDIPGAGVSRDVGRCAGCGAVVRNAVLRGNDLQVPAIRVNAAPLEFVMADGRVLVMFQPHDQVCKNPKAILMPDGRKKVIG
jgi:hypothetical protein